MYWTYTVVAQRPKRRAKHPNLREDNFKIRPVQITQQPPVTGFYFFLCATFIILTRDGLLYKMGVEVAIYNSVPKYFQKSLKKKSTFKTVCLSKGTIWGMF